MLATTQQGETIEIKVLDASTRIALQGFCLVALMIVMFGYLATQTALYGTDSHSTDTHEQSNVVYIKSDTPRLFGSSFYAYIAMEIWIRENPNKKIVETDIRTHYGLFNIHTDVFMRVQ
jgi:hypothetical protein